MHEVVEVRVQGGGEWNEERNVKKTKWNKKRKPNQSISIN